MVYCKCGCEFPNSRWDSVAICPQCGRTYLNVDRDMFHPKAIDESWICVNCGAINDRDRPDGSACDICTKCGAPRWDEDDPVNQMEVMEKYHRPPRSAAASEECAPPRREDPAIVPSAHDSRGAERPAAATTKPSTDALAAEPDTVVEPAAILAPAVSPSPESKLQWYLLRILGFLLVSFAGFILVGILFSDGSLAVSMDRLSSAQYLVYSLIVVISGVAMILVASHKLKSR